MLSVGLFALVVAIGAVTLIVTVRLLDRWLVKVFDPAALPPPVKVRKAKAARYVPECAVMLRRENPDGSEERLR